MKVAIHQPNFIPWMPFFQKLAAADVFVFLRWCQFEKNGYQNRFRLDGKWFTMPVAHGLEPIAEKQYIMPNAYWNRIKLALPQHSGTLSELDGFIGENLQDTNIGIATHLAKRLGIERPIHLDHPTKRTGTDRLVELCQMVGADEYISGPSGPNYLEMEKFEKAGIRVMVHEATDRRPVLEAIGSN